MKCRDHEIELDEAARYLMNYGAWDETDHKWVWPFQKHHKFSYHIFNVMLRQRALKGSATFIRRHSATFDNSMTAKQLQEAPGSPTSS